jgi:hypothetical protein
VHGGRGTFFYTKVVEDFVIRGCVSIVSLIETDNERWNSTTTPPPSVYFRSRCSASLYTVLFVVVLRWEVGFGLRVDMLGSGLLSALWNGDGWLDSFSREISLFLSVVLQCFLLWDNHQRIAVGSFSVQQKAFILSVNREKSCPIIRSLISCHICSFEKFQRRSVGII